MNRNVVRKDFAATPPQESVLICFPLSKIVISSIHSLTLFNLPTHLQIMGLASKLAAAGVQPAGGAAPPQSSTGGNSYGQSHPLPQTPQQSQYGPPPAYGQSNQYGMSRLAILS